MLGNDPSDAKQSSSDRGNIACHSSDDDEGEGRLVGKWKMQSLLWVWKGQLMSN
jgi:hypothetical protein